MLWGRPLLITRPSRTQKRQPEMIRTTIVFVAVVGAMGVVLSAPQQPTPQPTKEPIAIVKLNSDVSPDGSFSYEYETANQIKAEARGSVKNAGNPETEALSVTGSFSFVGEDGQTYSITYIADENGFQPQGAHLPTPPPIPEAILKSLEFNEKNPEPNQPAN